MPVTDVSYDHTEHTLTIVARFAAPIDRVWLVYADPRQLEQVWGAPNHPARFHHHELVRGAKLTYYVTGLQGEKYYGYWRVTDVDPPHSFSFDDHLADEDYRATPDAPKGHTTYTLEADGDETIVTSTTRFASHDDLAWVLESGGDQRAALATNQIDDLLAADPVRYES